MEQYYSLMFENTLNRQINIEISSYMCFVKLVNLNQFHNFISKWTLVLALFLSLFESRTLVDLCTWTWHSYENIC